MSAGSIGSLLNFTRLFTIFKLSDSELESMFVR